LVTNSNIPRSRFSFSTWVRARFLNAYARNAIDRKPIFGGEPPTQLFKPPQTKISLLPTVRPGPTRFQRVAMIRRTVGTAPTKLRKSSFTTATQGPLRLPRRLGL